ncbi:MAG: HEPN domain-containing protein [Elusimicrobiota bacterium]|jgi:uncharacterized protein (UPF0332 family)|nr:HEPN domain-containing protein [Elusimicrobiota bacterium]
MAPRNEILVTIAVEKSKLAIKAAQDSIKDSNLENALNRIYYSVFYIVMALAYKNDFITSKHSQLMGWFNNKFIYENKVFDDEIHQIYKKVFLYRQKGDYDLEYVPEIETVNELLLSAKKFIENVSKII